MSGGVDAADFESLELYDPRDQDAAWRLELLKYLTGLGATADDLVEYRDMLPALAIVLALRGGAGVSIEEASANSGVPEEKLRRLVRAAGFPDPRPGARIYADGFVNLASILIAVGDVFGEETVFQLARVLGSSMARVADAVVSAFLVNIEPEARRRDPVGLAVAKANVEAASLLPLVPPLFDALFRQHLLAAQRTVVPEEQLVGYETQHLVVGFVDLVGSTQLAEQLGIRELGELLTTFENLSADTVTAGGGRVVKLIGDEIMFTATDVRAASLIALQLSRTFRDHPLVPSVRAALASGAVMLRDGDAFGPVVNLAARAVKLARPDEVVVTLAVAAASGLPSEPRGRQKMKGISEDVEFVSLLDA